MKQKGIKLLTGLLLVTSLSLSAQGLPETQNQEAMTPTPTEQVEALKKNGMSFDFSTWKVQLPTPNEEKTSVKEVKHEELTKGYTDDNFYRDENGAIVFDCPVNGFKTANTTYSRSELRELIDGEHSDVNWTLHGTHMFNCLEKVTKQPSNGRIVVSQIHGVQQDGSNGPVLVKVEYDGAEHAVVVLLKTATYDNAADERYYLKDVQLGDVFATTIKVTEGRVFVTVRSDKGTLEASKDFYKADPNWSNYRFYFKVGDYVQDSVLDYEGEGGTVKLYSFNTSHSSDILKIAPTAINLEDKMTMEIGADVSLTPRFTPFDTTNTGCTWSIVKGSDVVAVSKSGQITARKLGTATVKVQSNENPLLSDTMMIMVGKKTVKEAKLLYSNDFSSPLGDEWSLSSPGNAKVAEKDGQLVYQDTDIGNPAKAILTLPEPVEGPVTIIADVRLNGMDIKDAGTAKEQASYYYFDINSPEGDNFFRIRNKADLNAGQLLDPRIVLSKSYLEPKMNAQAAKTPLGTYHTFTMVIRPEDHSAQANTTDVYIDGIKIGEKMKNNSKSSSIGIIQMNSGTKDLIAFDFDNLKVYEGEKLPEGVEPAPITVAATPSVLAVGSSFRIKTSDSTTFKVVKGAGIAAVSDSGLVTGLSSGHVSILVGNKHTINVTVVPSVVIPKSIEMKANSVTLHEGESADLTDYISVLPAQATEKGMGVTVMDGKECISVMGTKVMGLKTGTAKLQITALGNASLNKYITIAVVTKKKAQEVLFSDDFSGKKFDTNFWSIKTANMTNVEMNSDQCMSVVDDSMAGLPKAYVTFTPMASTFTISYKFMLLDDKQVSGSKSSCFTFALGADKITSTKNEAFRFKTNGSFNEKTNSVDNRHFIFSKGEGVSGFFDVDGTVEKNKWYTITLVTTPDNGSAKANTTDLYINGKKYVSAANKRIIPTFDKIIFETGTKDRVSFLIDDLSIRVGDMH